MKKITLLLTIMLGTCAASRASDESKFFIHVAEVTLLNYENKNLGQKFPTAAEYKDSYRLSPTDGQQSKRIDDANKAKSDVLGALAQGEIYADLRISQFLRYDGETYLKMKGSDKVADCTQLDIGDDAIHTPFCDGTEKVYKNAHDVSLTKSLTFNIFRSVSKQGLLSKIPQWKNKTWKNLTLQEFVKNFVLTIDFTKSEKFDWVNGILGRIDPHDDQVLHVIKFRLKTEDEKKKSQDDDDDSSDQEKKKQDSPSDQGSNTVRNSLIVIIITGAIGGIGYLVYQNSSSPYDKYTSSKQQDNR